MLINLLIFAITLSIDSLGVGITYGIRNIKIALKSILILLLISFTLTLLSISIGLALFKYLPVWFPNLLGCLLLTFMGIWIFVKSFKQGNGITDILNNPTLSDYDDSKSIDGKESLSLGLAMSTDSLICGVGLSMVNSFSLLFPFLVAIFQIAFLSLGMILGKKIKSTSSLSPTIWSKVSGIILILFGIVKLIF